MSFEGYEQRLCANGHYESFDVYAFMSSDDLCECRAPFVWFNIVDQTNGPDEGRIELEVATPPRYETSCGSQAMTARVTYKIPTDSGHPCEEE